MACDALNAQHLNYLETLKAFWVLSSPPMQIINITTSASMTLLVARLGSPSRCRKRIIAVIRKSTFKQRSSLPPSNCRQIKVNSLNWLYILHIPLETIISTTAPVPPPRSTDDVIRPSKPLWVSRIFCMVMVSGLTFPYWKPWWVLDSCQSIQMQRFHAWALLNGMPPSRIASWEGI